MPSAQPTAQPSAPTASIRATCFDTPLGPVAVVTQGERLRTLRQPAARAAHEAFLREAFPGVCFGEPSPLAGRLAQAVLRLFDGEPVDFGFVPLETAGLPPFHLAVYEATRALAPGQTTTYGALADALGSRGAARAVGQALARNPFGLVVPCHRVLAAGGRPGGFTAEGGLETKRRILACEGVALRPSRGAPRQLALRIQNTMS